MLLIKWNPGTQLGGAYHMASASLTITRRRSVVDVRQLMHLQVRRTERVLHSEACLKERGVLLFVPL